MPSRLLPLSVLAVCVFAAGCAPTAIIRPPDDQYRDIPIPIPVSASPVGPHFSSARKDVLAGVRDGATKGAALAVYTLQGTGAGEVGLALVLVGTVAGGVVGLVGNLPELDTRRIEANLRRSIAPDLVRAGILAAVGTKPEGVAAVIEPVNIAPDAPGRERGDGQTKAVGGPGVSLEIQLAEIRFFGSSGFFGPAEAEYRQLMFAIDLVLRDETLSRVLARQRIAVRSKTYSMTEWRQGFGEKFVTEAEILEREAGTRILETVEYWRTVYMGTETVLNYAHRRRNSPDYCGLRPRGTETYKPERGGTGPVQSSTGLELAWEAFDTSNVSNLGYELRVWRLDPDSDGRELVYRRNELTDNTHWIDIALPKGEYAWSVRAHFDRDGRPGFTNWSHYYAGPFHPKFGKKNLSEPFNTDVLGWTDNPCLHAGLPHDRFPRFRIVAANR